MRHWLDDPKNVKLVWRAFLGVLAATVAIEAVVAMHPHFAVESIFGFNAIYGLVACAALILGAKALGAMLKKPDTYYERDDD